ncbi:MAG: PAS domain S-box protein [Xanthomonadales bacterium]|nr:PAS domain S-box protein [Gammaproteobacteria bacterium]NNK03810.1 PAS domain S-box protein [Xanthomonadales bacterium]
MMRFLFFISIFLHSLPLYAGLKMQFKYPDGTTNWQHVANWSGGTLILLLSITVINLFLTRRQVRKSNRELNEIRNRLELLVQERTATLDESNRLLKDSNKLLEDEIAGHVSTASRLRASESYIKNILSSMPLILIGVNKDGRITQWNKQAEFITGIKAEDVLNKNLWDAYPAITVSPDQVREALEKNETITIKHSQRGQYYFDITLYPLQDQVEAGVVILIDDVTKKILAENMLIQNDKISSMGELASSMAHDINTPLQSILFDLRNFQSLLADGSQYMNEIEGDGMPDKIRHLLSHANEKGEKMASIVQNLQDFARGRSDRKQLSNIVDLMENTLELAGDVLSGPSGLKFNDIRIERNYEENLPMIPCYVTELQQVFLSLFRHAYDALGRVNDPAHKPTIVIQMNVSYDSFWIRIQHNGVGITSEDQSNLFEPFVRKDTPEVDYDAGKRLSFAYFIITEQHQGYMAVTSDINVGTTFHIQMLLK